MLYKNYVFLVFCLVCFGTPGMESFLELSQEEVNKRVESKALETYSRINKAKKWSYPKLENMEKRKGMFFSYSTDIWESGPVGVLLNREFQIEIRHQKKSGFLLSEALNALENMELEVDCALVVNYVLLRCLQALLGTENLDTLCTQWEKKHEQSFLLSKLGYNPLCTLFFDMHKISPLEWMGRGALCYLLSDPAYGRELAQNHTFVDTAENIIQAGFREGEPVYMGFDEDSFPIPLSIKEIKESLKKRFEETAREQGKELSWNDSSFESCNSATGLFIHTFSANLINAHLKNKDLGAAEEKNSQVLTQTPSYEILSDEHFQFYLLTAKIQKQLDKHLSVLDKYSSIIENLEFFSRPQ